MKTLLLLSIFVGVYGAQVLVDAQTWRSLTPLVSTCEDLKGLFKITQCQYPVTFYDEKDYRLAVTFPESCREQPTHHGECWNVPSNTVLSISIGLNKGILLREFSSDYSGYKMEVIPDVPDSILLVNTKLGIRLTVLNYSSLPSSDIIRNFNMTSLNMVDPELQDKLAVQHIFLQPTLTQQKALRKLYVRKFVCVKISEEPKKNRSSRRKPGLGLML